MPGMGSHFHRPDRGDADMAENAGFMLVPVSGGRAWAKVDPDDYDTVMAYRWCLGRSGNRRTTYAQRNAGGTTQAMHTFITGLAKVDHVNHDGLDNRRVNLRDGSGCGNERNSRKSASRMTSAYKGVSWRAGGSKHGPGWEAHIRIAGRQVYLGKFVDERAAAEAYDIAAVEHYGEFACLNFATVGSAA
jgi:hypothetical protein